MSSSTSQLGHCNQIWQLSLFMQRLLGVLLKELDNCSINRQNELMQFLHKPNKVTLDQITDFKQSFLAFLDESGPYKKTLEGLQEAHLDNISLIMRFAILRSDNKSMDAHSNVDALVVGYIRQHIESELTWYVPDGVKHLCRIYYGRVIMDSCILTLNDRNCVAAMLANILQVRTKSLQMHKTYDSTVMGFDARLFDQIWVDQRNDHIHSVLVMETNFQHIFVTYFQRKPNVMHQQWLNPQSFFLRKNYESSPRKTTPHAMKETVYIFPNEFDFDLLANMDSSNIDSIFSKQAQGVIEFPGKERINEFDAEKCPIDIARFELFKICVFA